jgi:tetratricopeptide (TPR) repeat protein
MTYEQPQNIRVFVSSTFVDLFGEREYLVKRVFPEIRHICRERGLIFTEVDLRWGLTYEDSSFGRVISTCLQEIDRCRPFFIGILGDRYGWIPEFHDIHRNAYLMEEHRWLEEAVLEGSSLVEMEFNYAVLNSLEPMPGASFYVLEREEAETRPHAEQDELAKQKLDLLRQRIFDSKRPVRTFSTAKELGNLVREDLLRAIDVLHPAKNERHPLQRERRLHEAFSISRRQAYVARQETLARLTNHTLGNDQPLIVHGASGVGKSALLAYWSRFFAQRHPDMTVVTHFIGSVSSDTGHEGLLRRILMEIKDLLGIEDEVPNSVTEMESALTGWLAKVPEKKLVLVIDALNQLEPRAAGLEWLPQHLPTNVRIIFSTTPGTTLEALRTREWPEFELLPLTISDREAMITRFLSEFHKSLTLAECKEIARNEKTSSPLFLRTFLEELRLFGTFEKLDEQIAHFLASDDIGDLFQRVLERIESDFGIELTRKVMSYVWASKSGLTEDDLLALTKLHRSEASQLLITLEYHLVQRQGYIRFFHDYLREAVERKYLSTPEAKLQAHKVLAEFYLAEPTSQFRAEELPWQLSEAEMWEQLHAWLTDIPEFMRYVDEDSQWKYLSYWLKLGDRYDAVTSYKLAIERYRSSANSKLEFAKVLDRVGRFLRELAKYEGAEEFLKVALELVQSELGIDHPNTAHALNALGVLYQTAGEYKKAEPLLGKALEILEANSDPNSTELARALNSFGILLFHLGKYQNAEELLARAVAINEEVLGPSHQQTIESLTSLGVMLYSNSKLDEAENAYSQALLRTKIASGEDNTQIAVLTGNLAAIERMRGQYKKSEALYRETLLIYERLLGPSHPLTAMSIQNLAVVMKGCGDLETAEPLYRRALDISKKSAGEHSPTLVLSLNNLALLLIEKGEFNEAQQLLTDSINIARVAFGIEHPLTTNAYLHCARMFERQGRYNEAVELYDRHLPSFDPRDSSQRERKEHLESYVRVLTELGRKVDAEDAQKTLLLIQEKRQTAQTDTN